MSKPDEIIELGDKVLVQYADGQNLKATVLYVPGGAGDMWRFKPDKGGVIYQNPSSIMLETIRLVSKAPVSDAF